MDVRSPRSTRGSTLEAIVALALVVGAAIAVTVALIGLSQAVGLAAWVPVVLLLALASLLLLFD